MFELTFKGEGLQLSSVTRSGCAVFSTIQHHLFLKTVSWFTANVLDQSTEAFTQENNIKWQPMATITALSPEYAHRGCMGGSMALNT